jgi:hypothetical protein
VGDFFNNQLIEERINANVLDKHPLPANNFLFPSKVDANIEDLVNDKKGTKLLELQNQKHLQTKKCLSPYRSWDELDGA